MGKKAGSDGSGRLMAQTRGLLRRYGIRAKKGLGQHFLIEEEALGFITAAAELGPADIVMEIGPGLGVLTGELVRQAGWVFAIELDDKLAAILKETLAAFNNMTVVNRDVLDITPSDLLTEQKVSFPGAITNPYRYKVVANLPYYITSPVLRHFLETRIKPEIMVVMVQKEVAEAIVAKPGQMSMLSIAVQYYGEPSIINYVPARSFYPVPEVDSAILRVKPYPRPPLAVADERSFFELVRAGFRAARKQLVNSLAQGLGCSKIEALTLLEKANIEPRRRAETLTLDEWAKLWRVFQTAKEGEKHADS